MILMRCGVMVNLDRIRVDAYNEVRDELTLFRTSEGGLTSFYWGTSLQLNK